jgi:hypothetical protein
MQFTHRRAAGMRRYLGRAVRAASMFGPADEFDVMKRRPIAMILNQNKARKS